MRLGLKQEGGVMGSVNLRNPDLGPDYAWPEDGPEGPDSMVVEPDHTNIATEAAKLVCGDRNDSYGDPADDYAGTAKIWSGLLIQKLKPGLEITPREAILMMAALKLRREVTKPKRDNRVDAIGYVLCADWTTTGVKPSKD